jgi:hypothetical protein
MSEAERLKSLQDFFPGTQLSDLQRLAPGEASPQAAQAADRYGEFLPFPGSIPMFPPGSSTPRYVMPDGSRRSQ